MATSPRSTQEQNPGKAVWRTILEVGVPAFVGLVVILPPILDAIATSELAAMLPPDFRATVTTVLATTAAIITGAAALGARILAIPGVANWLRKYARFLAPDNEPPEHRA